MTAPGRRKKKRKTSRARSILFVAVLFAGLAVLFSLTAPSSGFVSRVRTFFYGNLGWLSFFVPLILFQTAASVIRAGVARKGFRIVGGGFLIAYFLAALAALIGSRYSPDFIYVPGGRVAGGLAVAGLDLLGAPITWLALFTCFVATLVVVTGWDLIEDLSRLSARTAALFGSRPKRTRTTGRPGQSLNGTPAQGDSNAWSRDSAVPDVLPPFVGEGGKPGTRTSPPAAPKPVRTAVPVSVRSAQPVDADCVYELPDRSILTVPPPSTRTGLSEKELRERARLLIEKLSDFGIDCEFASSYPGPVLTRFELIPGSGVKINRILNLSDDLALALAAKRIRILAPVPGKGAVGIEVPNPEPETVHLGEILGRMEGYALPIAMGKKLEGEPFVADICNMPHLLIAGATGSGKSICIHSIITTLLMTRTPREVRLAMVDPKMLELSVYEGIPHLWAPVVLETSKARMLLEALVEEMESRYSRLARLGVRSINEFNDRLTGESEDERIPYIVVVIDELADLMMVSANEVEPSIARLAQMARAVGIHLVVATQRPSVDVITGMIKANFPSRIAFNVQSKTDSRTILDMNGAEKLLGQGDMLFLPSASPEPIRIHGSYVSTDEIKRIAEHWRGQPAMPLEFEFPEGETGNLATSHEIRLDDPLLKQARDLVVEHQQGSVSLLQRRLRVGYARAARLIDMLEQTGVVGPFLGSKAREVLVQPESEPGMDEDEGYDEEE